jgi:hypothetical protein
LIALVKVVFMLAWAMKVLTVPPTIKITILRLTTFSENIN